MKSKISKQKQGFAASKPYCYPDGTAKRRVADRARKLVDAAWTIIGHAVLSDQGAADLRSIRLELTSMYRALESSPKRMLIRREAQYANRAIGRLLREHDVAPAGALAVTLPDATPLDLGLPEALEPAAPTYVQHYVPGSAPVTPVGRIMKMPTTEYGWLKFNLAHEGRQFLDEFMQSRRQIQRRYARTRGAAVKRARYIHSPQGKAARKAAQARYAKSEQGKAARKAANARYYAKRKERENQS